MLLLKSQVHAQTNLHIQKKMQCIIMGVRMLCLHWQALFFFFPKEAVQSRAAAPTTAKNFLAVVGTEAPHLNYWSALFFAHCFLLSCILIQVTAFFTMYLLAHFVLAVAGWHAFPTDLMTFMWSSSRKFEAACGLIAVSTMWSSICTK